MGHLEVGRKRVLIEGVRPEIDGGRYPAKRVVGERVLVEADIYADGHDAISAVLLYHKAGDVEWKEAPMLPQSNDRWRGEFEVSEIGYYRYTVLAWIDQFKSWSESLRKHAEAKQDVTVEILMGANLLVETSQRTAGGDKRKLLAYASELRSGSLNRVERALDPNLSAIMERYPERGAATRYEKELTVVVDREKARFSSWYEMFPRSCSANPGKHGTLKDCEKRLEYIAALGFDILYLPPIHPIGDTHRKGKNSTLRATARDPGSPWAVGGVGGGHKDIHPELGTLGDFKKLIKKSESCGVELAMDLAFHCSPDHPYVNEHPEWFRKRPDGGIQFAVNPPKKYEDIYPMDFSGEHWREIWDELMSVVVFWIKQGIRIYRVDNPHTKPFSFWEFLINGVKREYPDVIFLAEAFTRPKVMYGLAKLGFSQSYTYFAWRNTKWELTQYFTEVNRTDIREFFHANLWPNTPDILTEYLQSGGVPAFMTRLILAATLGANYGIYGPAFELCENRALETGSEEYLNSEKFEIKRWDLSRAENLKELITKVNRIRRENPALQSDRGLLFHPVDNERLICYSKQTEDLRNIILVVVNLDPHHTQSGWVELPLELLGPEPNQAFQVHDLLTTARYLWHGRRNYVEVVPHAIPAHIFRIEHRNRTERDFHHFM